MSERQQNKYDSVSRDSETSLYHFTSLEKLPSILRNGIPLDPVPSHPPTAFQGPRLSEQTEPQPGDPIEIRLTIILPKNQLHLLERLPLISDSPRQRAIWIFTGNQGIPSEWITQIEQRTPRQKYQRIGLQALSNLLKKPYDRTLENNV